MRLLTLVLVSTVVSGCHPRSSRAAVFMTTDCGVEIDDQWALTHLALSPEFDLRGIVSTHASSVHYSSVASAQCASDVLKRVAPARAGDVPVIAGSDAPLQNVRTAHDNAGVQLLLRVSRQYSSSDRLVVLSTGAATDLASAILEDASIAGRVRLVAMGFTDWPRGGPEFNITNDPLAWQVILASKVPLVVGSAEAAKRSFRMTSRDAAAIMRPHGAIGEYLFMTFDWWLATNPELVAQIVSPATWVIWDEVVVASALGLAEGDEVAQPRLEPDLSFSHPTTNERITWITRIDSDRVWRDFTRKIDHIQLVSLDNQRRRE